MVISSYFIFREKEKTVKSFASMGGIRLDCD
jgi:hypothetical protein